MIYLYFICIHFKGKGSCVVLKISLPVLKGSKKLFFLCIRQTNFAFLGAYERACSYVVSVMPFHESLSSSSLLAIQKCYSSKNQGCQIFEMGPGQNCYGSWQNLAKQANFSIAKFQPIICSDSVVGGESVCENDSYTFCLLKLTSSFTFFAIFLTSNFKIFN